MKRIRFLNQDGTEFIHPTTGEPIKLTGKGCTQYFKIPVMKNGTAMSVTFERCYECGVEIGYVLRNRRPKA